MHIDKLTDIFSYIINNLKEKKPVLLDIESNV